MSNKFIKEYLQTVPQSAGVYQMLNANRDIIYIGKAKNLRNRIANYTQIKDHTYRIQQMIMQTYAMEVIRTNNELEALLLEANLIRKHKPRYNILLKDDKLFPYLLIREDHNYPQITKYRGMKDIKGVYYGPFTSTQKINETMSYLEKAFLLRSCSDNYFATRKRPCLLYQVKRCSAPCVQKIKHEEYLLLVNQAKDFLAGKTVFLQQNLVTKMQQASNAYNYEEASIYRDRIKMVSYIQAKQVVDIKEIGDADVIAVFHLGGVVAVQIFFFRLGQNLGKKTYFPEHVEDESNSKILDNFLLQFYSKNHIPPLIITSDQPEEMVLVKQALQKLAGRRIDIEIPKHGKKLDLVKFALNDIKYEIEKSLASKVHYLSMMQEVKFLFGLSTEIKRIEIYDNSHISGKFAVGAMVVAGEEGLEKNKYRKYNINFVGKKYGGDDYAMLREVLNRRFKRDLPRPDLILIDGGSGHLSVAVEVLKSLAIEGVYAVSIAKGSMRNAGRESFFTVDKGEFTLSRDSKVMKYLQILRDEAHRFAITAHRVKRSSAIRVSILDRIPGVGAKRKKILLNHFGSVENIENASLEQLQKVNTIKKYIAEKIYGYFHK